MIRLHERQLAMLVLHFCLRYTIQCITRAPRVQYYLEWAPHQIVPSQALLSQSDTESHVYKLRDKKRRGGGVSMFIDSRIIYQDRNDINIDIEYVDTLAIEIPKEELNTNHKLTSFLRIREEEYYEEKLELNKNDLRKSWKIIKEIIGKKKTSYSNSLKFNINGKPVSDKFTISNAFNNYFIEIGPQLERSINTTVNPLTYVVLK